MDSLQILFTVAKSPGGKYVVDSQISGTVKNGVKGEAKSSWCMDEKNKDGEAVDYDLALEAFTDAASPLVKDLLKRFER